MLFSVFPQSVTLTFAWSAGDSAQIGHYLLSCLPIITFVAEHENLSPTIINWPLNSCDTKLLQV